MSLLPLQGALLLLQSKALPWAMRLLPLQGALFAFTIQGAALGYALAAPSGRSFAFTIQGVALGYALIGLYSQAHQQAVSPLKFIELTFFFNLRGTSDEILRYLIFISEVRQNFLLRQINKLSRRKEIFKPLGGNINTGNKNFTNRRQRCLTRGK